MLNQPALFETHAIRRVYDEKTETWLFSVIDIIQVLTQQSDYQGARLVQSVPSPKAEPIKLWLAKVGYERMQEMSDPALSLDRARETWLKHGRSEKWIQQRMTGQETRNKLTDYWANHDIKQGEEFAILTNLIHQEWAA